MIYQRDIPMPLVTSGVDHGNLRELCLERMQELDLQCRDGARIVFKCFANTLQFVLAR